MCESRSMTISPFQLMGPSSGRQSIASAMPRQLAVRCGPPLSRSRQNTARNRNPGATIDRRRHLTSCRDPKGVPSRRKGMVHFDIKKLGRISYLGHRATGDRHGQKHGVGWEFVHVAVDDRARVAYMELLPHERAETARVFRPPRGGVV